MSGVGKRYDPVEYPVTAESITAYAAAVEDRDPLYVDAGAARAAGFADVVAPPMYAVVYAGAAVGAGLFDPELGIDFSHLVHGSQEFRWPGPAVVAGDRISTVLSVHEIRETAGLKFYVFRTESRNQRDQTVCEGLWTNIVRPPEEAG